MSKSEYATRHELEQKLQWVVDSPKDEGVLRMITIRPQKNHRQILTECAVSPDGGLEGDSWARECWKTLDDGRPHPDVQVTMMSSRVVSLLASEEGEQAMAGDQLYADLDLGEANLPVGQRLEIGTAVFEVTPEPHTGCRKFSARFGPAAVKFMSVPERRAMRLRGVYLKVAEPGSISVGDLIRKR
jgi:hypothetical protein